MTTVKWMQESKEHPWVLHNNTLSPLPPLVLWLPTRVLGAHLPKKVVKHLTAILPLLCRGLVEWHTPLHGQLLHCLARDLLLTALCVAQVNRLYHWYRLAHTRSKQWPWVCPLHKVSRSVHYIPTGCWLNDKIRNKPCRHLWSDRFVPWYYPDPSMWLSLSSWRNGVHVK